MTPGKGLSGVVCAALVCVSIGCATPIKKPEKPVFFPAAPAPPRIQFLMSFSGLNDINPQSAFDRFVAGKRMSMAVDKPYGVAVLDGKIYVCDTNGTLVVFDFKRKTLEPIKGAIGQGKLRSPLNISLDAEGNKYVSDPVRGQVVVFDRNDEYVRAYGTSGAWRPVDAVPFGDMLYVADMENRVIKVFDKQSGEVVRTIGDKGDPAERLNRPTNLAFDSQGYLAVSDVGRFQVVKYDRDGHFKMAIGKAGDNLGHFARPKGVAVDREDRLYAVDASFNNVQIFNPQGRLLMFFGGGGDAPGGLLLPAKVAIDYDSLKWFEPYVEPGFHPEYLIVATSQFGAKRVSVFAFGKQEGQEYPSDAELLKRIEERQRQEIEQELAAPPAEGAPAPPPR